MLHSHRNEHFIYFIVLPLCYQLTRIFSLSPGNTAGCEISYQNFVRMLYLLSCNIAG